MKAELISNGGRQFLRVELEEFNQKGESFYIAKILASQFLKIHTVRPAEYDLEKHAALARSFPEESAYYDHLMTADKARIAQKDFQREPDSSRIASVVRYLRDERYALFPNTIISSCELINDWDEYDIGESSSFEEFLSVNRPDYLSFYQRSGSSSVLFIPYIDKSVLVIDGQHRLEGLKRIDESILNEYELLIAFIIGYDRSVIAKQFYTINYEQKPVNKSLLYQLTGEFTVDVSEISFMHNVVKLLNELAESPFYGRVKMLGKTPKNLNDEAKAKLSISQAFLIDSMIRFVSPKAKGTLFPPIFLPYYLDSREHIMIVRAIARYFNAVREIKSDWEDPGMSIISKGMGVAALLKVFNLMFPKILSDALDDRWDRLDDVKISDYRTFLAGLENVNFYSDGPYGKMGSEGSITRIKNDILANLSFFGNPTDIKAFEIEYRRTILSEFEEKLLMREESKRADQ